MISVRMRCVEAANVSGEWEAWFCLDFESVRRGPKWDARLGALRVYCTPAERAELEVGRVYTVTIVPEPPGEAPTDPAIRRPLIDPDEASERLATLNDLPVLATTAAPADGQRYEPEGSDDEE